jgi:hypothetical protein
MYYVRLIVYLWIATALSGCASVRVSQDYDVASDFSQFQTFGWSSDAQPKTGDIRTDNPLLDARIRKAVEQALVGKGLRQVDKGTPDFTAAYRLAVQPKIDSSPVSIGVGTGFGIGSGSYGGIGVGTSNVESYDEGLLIIDFTDTKNGDLIWRGTGSKRLTRHSDPQKTTEEVYSLVDKILEQYPPTTKK